jgi:ABC-type nitrate/sulfonate/bicarbonate transport system substrate-binding protein
MTISPRRHANPARAKISLSRRNLLLGAAAAAAVPAWSQPSIPTLGVVSFPGPSTSAHSKVIIVNNGFDREHGWQLRWELRPTSDTFYKDFTTGEYESIDFGGLNVFANLHNRGVPLKLVQATVNWPIPLLARKSSGIKSFADLKGKKVAVGRASFAFAQLVGAARAHGIDLEKDAEVSNVDFFQAVPRLKRGDFDAAIVILEHAIQIVNEQPNEYAIVGDAGDEFAKAIGVPKIYQYQAIRTEWLDKNAQYIQNVVATYRDNANFFANRAPDAVRLLARPLNQKGANLDEKIGHVEYVTGTSGGLKTTHVSRPVRDIERDIMIELEAYKRSGMIEKVPAKSFLMLG